MKYLLSLFIVILALTSCSDSRTTVMTESELPEDLLYLPDQIKPYTGKCIIFYSGTEKVKEELTFRHGILNGGYISYYENGNVKIKGAYSKGRLNGIWESYTKSGEKVYEVQYHNDTLKGNYISWYNTGVIKEKGNYKENKREGEWFEYDEAGMILSKVSY